MLKNKSVRTPLDTRQCQQPLKLKTFSDGKISRVTVQYRHKQYSPIFRFYYVNSFFFFFMSRSCIYNPEKS